MCCVSNKTKRVKNQNLAIGCIPHKIIICLDRYFGEKSFSGFFLPKWQEQKKKIFGSKDEEKYEFSLDKFIICNKKWKKSRKKDGFKENIEEDTF